MKAAILEKFNKNGNDLVIKDIVIPKVGNRDVLVKINAVGVNPLDNMIIRKEVHLIVPYTLPLIMGNEFVGVIEDKGQDVKGFDIGDRVYARMPLDKIGAFAEYTVIDYKYIAKVPEYLSDEEAAAVPLTALTALQSYKLMDVQTNNSIFISGGTGSLGAMAIPIAKSFGLKVYTSGNGNSEERVKNLGADVFIDYKKEDYANVIKDVDYVLDSIGEKELLKEFSILKNGGKLVSLRALPNREFAYRMNLGHIKKLLFSLAGSKYDNLAKNNNQKYYFLFVEADGEGLKYISKLFDEKKIKPSVDEIYNLSEINEALKKVKQGKSKGKTIIKF